MWTRPFPSDPAPVAEDYFRSQIARVEHWLDRLLPAEEESPSEIHRAMRYSVFAGGKRLRPILAIAAGEIYRAPEHELLPVAAALEMIHTYSLIHDDLPAMDDDDLRRGRPTCHLVFGEALAILAGDALLTQAFRTLAEAPIPDLGRKVWVISEVARGAGTARALIGGQVLDLQFEGQPVTADQLEAIHRAKTGALIRCAVRCGAIIGGAEAGDLDLLSTYGEKAGLAFQIADDLLDQTATSEELGKTAGKDAAAHKATYTALYGLDGARERALLLCREALDALHQIPRETQSLEQIAHFIVERKS
jgi:geranylgeranyl pyrophosphate synthase